MDAELKAAPETVKRQEQVLSVNLTPLVARLRHKPPQVVVTCARGSSAHAATFGKHLIERYLGIPVAAAAPNIASVYRKRLRLGGQLFLVISQSGTSADLIEQAAAACDSGAVTACITNDTCPYRKLDPTGVQPRIGRCFLVWGFFWQGISGRRSSDPSSSKGSNSGEPRALGIALGQANSGPQKGEFRRILIRFQR